MKLQRDFKAGLAMLVPGLVVLVAGSIYLSVSLGGLKTEICYFKGLSFPCSPHFWPSTVVFAIGVALSFTGAVLVVLAWKAARKMDGEDKRISGKPSPVQ